MSDWPEGVERRIFGELDSTMAEAARLAPSLAGATWILAHRQIAGRGRRGRNWLDCNGNFAATLIWRPDGPVAARPLRSFLAALALLEALRRAGVPEAAMTLKWPNDVLLNGGKLAGILLESLGDHLAIGFGVNLLAAPADADLPESALHPVSLGAETGLKLTPEAFLDLLAPAFDVWETRFSRHGFGPVRRAWLARADRLGRTITARTPQARITGRFETVDEQGCLILNAPDGRHRIAAADVFFAPLPGKEPQDAFGD